MAFKLKTLLVSFLPIFAVQLMTSSAAPAELSQNEKLKLIHNITSITGWAHEGERERRGVTFYRFNSKENPNVFLVVTDLKALSDEISKTTASFVEERSSSILKTHKTITFQTSKEERQP